MTKRHPADKDLRRKASRDFYANEVCWALNIAANLGLSALQAMEMADADYEKWQNHVNWETYD